MTTEDTNKPETSLSRAPGGESSAGDIARVESSLAQLSKKIDEQARFTRSVTIICTLTILGVVFYTMTEMFSSLPSNIVLQFMGNMEKIVAEWKLIENNMQMRQRRSESVAPAPPPPAPKEKTKSE